MQRTIIEVAVNAIGGRERGPNNPVSPAEVEREIIACLEAGAGIVHNHIDGYGLSGSQAAARNGECWSGALRRYPDAILYSTLAAAPADSELGAYSHIVETATRYGARMGVLDTGSLNLSGGGPGGQPNPLKSIAYNNSYATLDKVLTAYAKINLASSIAVYDPTFLRAALAYERADRLARGSFLKLYFGGPDSYLDGKPGVGFGLPPTIKALEVYLEMMEGSRLPWAAAVVGGDLLADKDFVRAVLSRGGHLRVGLEDYSGSRPRTNVELVAEAVEAATAFGRPAASPTETMEILLHGN